jgi:acyl-CoA thioesterase-1
MTPMRFCFLLCLLFPVLTFAAPATTQSVSDMIKTFPLESAKLDKPFWRSKTVWGESLLFIAADEDTPAEGTLLLRPSKVRAIRNSRTGEIYEEGRDYHIDAARRRLVLTETSRIPKLNESDLFKKANAPNSLGPKVGDPQTWLLWSEYGFADKQVDVDYDTDESWDGYTPKPSAALSRTVAKLKAAQPLRIVISGDSISAGGNASASHHDAPYQPAYPALLAAGLQEKYRSPISMLNVAVGGLRSEAAMNDLARVIAAAPDLIIVAYGMNDVGLQNPAAYAHNIQQFIDAVRVKCPQTEFILVATSLGNPLWSAIPADQFPKYRDALAALCSDERHIALADMTTLWSQMLARKRYHDLTGNGLNHPNDFGHRLYAEVLLDLVRERSR